MYGTFYKTMVLPSCMTGFRFYIWLFLFSLLTVLGLSDIKAQSKVFQKPDLKDLKKDTLNRKFSLHAEDNQIIDAREDPATQFLNGNVKVYHSRTFMFCDTAIIRGSILRMRHRVVMLQNDTIRIFADSMIYNADSLVAYLYGDIILENGQKKLYTSKLRYNVSTKVAEYNQNALLEQDSSRLVSKKGVYFVHQKKAVFKENVKVDGSDFVLYSDSIGFETETQITHFLAPTRIKRDTVDIYAEDGWFDLDDKKGDFIKNAQYRSGNASALADTIHYDGKRDLVILSSDARTSTYISETDTAFAKKITYDRKNEFYTLKGDAYYKSTKNQVEGPYVEFDKKTEKFKTRGRSTVSDPPMVITADTLDYDKSVKIGVADGGVIWRDTSAKTTIYSDHVRYRGDDNFLLAYNEPGHRPYFTSEVDTTLMHMKADTFKSIRTLIPLDSLTTDTIDYFTGFNNVRVFKDDLQMICDSIVYNLKDSVFTLFDEPVVWSDTTQITGDTMHFYMKNKTMDKLSIRENGTIVHSEDLLYYDQIRGKYIDAGFEKGKMKNMKVDGDATVVYYLKDEQKRYIGVNQSRSSYITFRLDNNEITDILFYVDVKSKVYPMTTNHESIKIKGFKWSGDKRPSGIDDL
jgi:lipopolysaccharide export system protein LptA